MQRRFARCVAITSLILAAQRALAAQGPAEPTFTKDVAPILQRSCQNCHRPGGGAPMSLLTYEETRPWARSIKMKTASRDMPPWFIERNVGIQAFKDDVSLTDEEITSLGKWVDAGAPRGNPADMPPQRRFAEADTWNIGSPDLIVSSPTLEVKAIAADWHGEIVGESPSGLTEDRYVKAIEVREFWPRERSVGFADAVLHHTQVSARAPDGKIIPRESLQRRPSDEGSVDLLSYLWEVGQNPMVYPDEIGVKLPAGAVFYFPNTHTHANGKNVETQVQVGIKFHPKGYTPKYAKGLTALNGNLVELDFPPGQDNIRYDTFMTLSQPAKMVTFEPHMHALGKRMCMEAVYPSGLRQTLNCTRFIYTWMKQYVYDDDAAPLLPRGTILHITSWYDNSAGNRNNIDPRNWKGLGQRSTDDMFSNLSKLLYLTDAAFEEAVATRQAKLAGLSR